MNIRIPETFNFDPAMLKRIAELRKSKPKKKTASKRKTTPRKAVARKVPVRTRSVRKTPVRKAPVVKTPVRKAPVVKTPVRKAPVVKTPVRKAPVVKTPVRKAPVVKTPVRKAPVVKTPVRKAPVVKTPAVIKPVIAKAPTRPTRRPGPPKASVRKRTPVRKPSPPKAPKMTIEPLVIDVVENAMGAPSVPAPTRKKIPKKKTVARKTVAKKAASKSAIKSAISRGGKTGDKINAGLASTKRGKTVKGNPFLMGKSKAAPKKSVAKKKPVKPKLPEGVRSGGRTYTNPVSGDKMYQPPMPKLPGGMMGAQVMPTPINLTTGKPERVFLSEPTAPQPPATQQQTGGSFESAYIDWMESKPTQPRRPKGMGAASKKYQKANRDYKENLKQWEASKPSRASFVPSSPPPTAPTAPVVQPDYAPPPREELPDRLAGRYVPQGSILGTPDMSISSNIVGQSYDPNFAASFRPPPQTPGSTFGGYGQQAPMAALAPYAGMAQSQPMPTDFFPTYIPRPDPIIETVQRPEPNRPAPRPNQYPVMSSDIPGAIPGQTPGIDFDVFEQPF